MKISAKQSVQAFVQQSVALGLRQVVVSPGSRNAPLTISFNQHPMVRCTVIPDERAAAFFALGMAQQLNEPVALLCSSGSASTNYYPAVVEAYYQSIPLIVITADRPQALINQGEGQSIMQGGLYQKHVKFFAQLEDSDESESYLKHLKEEVLVAFQTSNGLNRGPVHINFALQEPLYDILDLDLPFQEIKLPKENPQLTVEEIGELRATWKSSKRIMILCGQLDPNPVLKEQLKLLAEQRSVLVLVENTSNLVDTSFVHCIDRSLNAIPANEEEAYAPDLLLSIGGAIVSKRIKSYLRKYKAKQHWRISPDFPEMDTYQNLTHSFPIEATTFFRQLQADDLILDADYGRKWKQKDLLIQDEMQHFFGEQGKWGDIYAFHYILDCIPENAKLHLANSSVVRYAQLFDPIRTITYRSNRGVSGIDGSSSTAVGAAFAEPDTWHNLISGDMSFIYDSNAFWNHCSIPNLRVFLINNGGGGIFKIIPGPDTSEELDDFFVFNNSFSAEHICKAFGLAYFKAASLDEIEAQMESFYTYEEKGQAKLMEIDTRGEQNEIFLKDFFERIKLNGQ